MAALDQPAGKLRCVIFPADLGRSVQFYVNVLGFELVRDERDDESPYVYMRRGEVRVGAVPHRGSFPEGVRQPPIGVELVLEVADLEAERDRMAAVWALSEEITSRPWGLRDFRLLDPDGYYWRITTG
jgi:catechol 2,3-dioxygenase-like lactoylglutathione lyase family enzyme